MKLLSAHIVNYGKLSDVSISFKDGLNSFCEQNGYGKSTISIIYPFVKNK